jgi:HSP20 family protein
MPMRRWLREREKWKTGLKMRWAFGGPERPPEAFGGTEPSPDYFGWTGPSPTYFGGTEPSPDYFGFPDYYSPPFGARPVFPPVDIYEENGKLVLIADIPGFQKDEIKVQIKPTEVILSGKRKSKISEEVEEENVYRVERLFDTFSRRVSLPVEIDPDTASAKFESGTLKITAQKVETGKEIPIE